MRSRVKGAFTGRRVKDLVGYGYTRIDRYVAESNNFFVTDEATSYTRHLATECEAGV